MTPTTSTTIKLDRDPGQLLAAIPHLLGFHPAESIVLIGHRPTEPGTIGGVLRADLPESELGVDQAQYLAATMAMSDVTAATIAVIGGSAGRAPGPQEPVPRAGMVDTLDAALIEHCLGVPHALWAPVIETGAPWRCYQDSGCSGSLPDPSGTAVAAAVTRAGMVTLGSREDLARLLDPDDPDALARRAGLLARSPCAPDGSSPSPERGRAAARAALNRARQGRLEVDDDQIVEMATALADVRTRDACLAMALPAGSDHATAAERLWTALVRATPEPERAEPAALLAYSAYMRGDGALAGMALDRALAADSSHVLARLLHRALYRGVPPERLRGLAQVDDVPGLP